MEEGLGFSLSPHPVTRRKKEKNAASADAKSRDGQVNLFFLGGEIEKKIPVSPGFVDEAHKGH